LLVVLWVEVPGKGKLIIDVLGVAGVDEALLQIGVGRWLLI
jgi:hypothetical protein